MTAPGARVAGRYLLRSRLGPDPLRDDADPGAVEAVGLQRAGVLGRSRAHRLAVGAGVGDEHARRTDRMLEELDVHGLTR